jgi:hypothetical protein
MSQAWLSPAAVEAWSFTAWEAVAKADSGPHPSAAEVSCYGGVARKP